MTAKKSVKKAAPKAVKKQAPTKAPKTMAPAPTAIKSESAAPAGSQ